VRRVLNDAGSIYLLDAASAFVVCWCAGMIVWFSSSRSIRALPVPRLESRSSNGFRRKTAFSSTHRSNTVLVSVGKIFPFVSRSSIEPLTMYGPFGLASIVTSAMSIFLLFFQR
jgi:hypothetical protein